MSSLEQRLALLEAQLQHLSDRQAILDCVARNARGCDRHDSELLASSYHSHSFDEHGCANVIAGQKYHEWANQIHAQGSIHNLHHITTHSCDINGDDAHAESYVIGLFLNPDGASARLISGRYIDKLARVDGEWKIVLRRSTVEVLFTGDAAIGNAAYFRNMGFLAGLRNKQDVSYQRPLNLDETPPGHRWQGEYDIR